MIKNLSCVSVGSLKRFPHTFTTLRQNYMIHAKNNKVKRTMVFISSFMAQLFWLAEKDK